MKDNTKLVIVIASLALIIALILGGTLAYWQWSTNAAQNTLVNASPLGPNGENQARMYIDFPTEDITNMYPTSDCEVNGTSSWVTEITVDNKTGIDVSPVFKLKVKIVDKNGNTITNGKNTGNTYENRYYIKYAVAAENDSCQNALITGRFDQNTQTNSSTLPGWYDSAAITLRESNGFPKVSGKIGSGVSFFVGANKQIKQRYRVYAWLDKNYTSVNVGGTVTDTMQDAKVSISWSENSTLEQLRKTKTGTAYAVYSADDESLRFYRSTTAITKGSTYNGRTVSEVYTGFETAVYTQSNPAPWTKNASILNVVVEDLIQPVSTAWWFGVSDSNSIFYFDVSKLDTSNVTNMSGMFYNCFFAEEILGLENFDTTKVTEMGSMFSAVAVHKVGRLSLDLSGWDTSNVTNMSGMFYDSRISADLSGWNVCNVGNYLSFSNSSITDLVMPNFDDPTKCNGGNPA